MSFLTKICGIFVGRKYSALEMKYGELYKIKGEALPFRYIYRTGDKDKGIRRFKHHNLKEYVFYNFKEVERKASKKEIKLYNLIRDHINEVARKEARLNHN